MQFTAMQHFILALDQGTTSSRAIVFGHDGRAVAMAQREFRQILPAPDAVEHDAEEIWQSQLAVAQQAVAQAKLDPQQIAAIGVTNQRETTILWDRHTGKPVANAIVWQSRVSASICDQLKGNGLEPLFRQKTGLVVDAYFSGTKIKHLLDRDESLRRRAQCGEILFGTVDSWLIWRLTGGRRHVTDVSNASRTLLLNIHTGDWDDELLGILKVPRAMLPEVAPSSCLYGHTEASLFGRPIPITGAAGDQQAATFGQTCFAPGAAKNTYGTGCFMLLNTGEAPVASNNNLLTTIGWKVRGKTAYCLEGSVFIAGAVVQWLRDGLRAVKSSAEIEALADTVEDSGGVYFVPALVGLGAPYWDPYARGTIIGITRGTQLGHIARAAIESMAFQTRDLLEAMQRDAGSKLATLRVDGGAAVNDGLLQFQADMLQTAVERPTVQETTALGAAYLAGLEVGFWKDFSDLEHHWALDRRFEPKLPSEQCQQRYATWLRAVERSRDWAEH
jgi:glycerol kinase